LAIPDLGNLIQCDQSASLILFRMKIVTLPGSRDPLWYSWYPRRE
jgi:hypothetical protein